MERNYFQVLIKILKTPHPTGFSWAYALIPAAMVVFILVTLAPYGFGELNAVDRIILALPFGIITALASSTNLFIAKYLFPKIIDEKNWTLGHEFLYNVYDFGIIGLWNAIFLKLTFRADEPFIPLLLRLEWHTFLVGIIPLITLIAYKHQSALQAQLDLTTEINKELQGKLDEKVSYREISFYSEKGAFELKLASGKILFLQSEGNYVEIYYLIEGGIKKHLVRNRLKILFDVLPRDEFVHCHKRFIVNMVQIIKAEGNARDLKLQMANNIEIPVSRNKSAELLQMLKN